MNAPDGMGADRYNERQNMAEARNVDEPNFDIIAVDSDGNELYVTESAWTLDAAKSETRACNDLLDSGQSDLPEGVEKFDYKKRE